VEDDDAARELLGVSFRKCNQFKLISAYMNGEEALKELPKSKPDVVLMDIRMPGMTGIECVAALRRLSPPFKSRVLILTEHEDVDLIFAALRAGADGYLLKCRTSHKELEAAMLQVLSGGGPMSPRIARKVIAYFQRRPEDESARARSEVAHGAELSNRQKEVLELATRGLTYKEMASHLEVSLNAVRKHLQSIYKKLHVRSRSDPLLYEVSRQHSGRPRI
jgi:DNA-binding NarL/FixJ family response regulator